MKRILYAPLIPLASATWAWAIVLAAESGRDTLVVATAGPLAIVLVFAAAMALVGLFQFGKRLFASNPLIHDGRICDDCGHRDAVHAYTRRYAVCRKCRDGRISA